MDGPHPRTSALASVLVLLAGSLLCLAQQPPDPPPAIAPEPVTLPANPAAPRNSKTARDYIQTEEWSEAVRLLQGLIETPEDSFLQLRADKGQTRSASTWVSVRGEAERLLAGLPRQGREFYQLGHEDTARRMLREAVGNRDLAQVSEVTRRFRFTESGSEAFTVLGTYYLDRGRPDLAGLCFERLLEHPGADKLSSLTLFKAALAFHRGGDRGRYQQTWQALDSPRGPGWSSPWHPPGQGGRPARGTRALAGFGEPARERLACLPGQSGADPARPGRDAPPRTAAGAWARRPAKAVGTGSTRHG